MQFAYQPRGKPSAANYLPRPRRLLRLPRSKRFMAGICLLTLVVWWVLVSRSRSTSPLQAWANRGVAEYKPSGKPAVVLVTVLDPSYPAEFVEEIRLNRELYAKRHGYETHIARYNDYDVQGATATWTKILAMHHAMTKFADAKWIWYLDFDVLLMNADKKLHDFLTDKALEETIIKNQPIVPPDSIIKTFSHVKGHEVDFVITQDKGGMSLSSFAMRNGEWAKFMLQTWFNPLYRSYNFQKAEKHAMEHIVQWHPTILSRLGVIPQRLINAYSTDQDGIKYEDGDVILRLKGCIPGAGLGSCDSEAKKFAEKWKKAYSKVS